MWIMLLMSRLQTVAVEGIFDLSFWFLIIVIYEIASGEV